MDKVAKLSTKERLELFEQVASQKQLSLEIIEKDFWVTWILEILFSLSVFKDAFIFKGGTSLSKVFGLINRFSEDIDISIKRETLGFIDEKDPEKHTSSTKQKKLVDELRDAYRLFVTKEIFPTFDKAVMEKSSKDWPPIWGHRVVGIDSEGQFEEGIITFRYPTVQPSIASYIPKEVRIEFGASSDPFPINDYKIKSYAEECFPHLFSDHRISLTVLEPERTFWEKATLVHAEAHRTKDQKTPSRYSRHYYDLYCLSKNEVGKRALKNSDLRKRVVQHKSIYFRSSWAKYDLAVPGSFRILPDQHRLDDLKEDYSKMAPMIYGASPSWEEIVEDLKTVESFINEKS